MASNDLSLITLFGNLGEDPGVFKVPERTETGHAAYDPITGQVKVRQSRLFSIDVSTQVMEEPCWIRCVDRNNDSPRLCMGDRVKLTGSFQLSPYRLDGQTQYIRLFVVKSVELLHHKRRNNTFRDITLFGDLGNDPNVRLIPPQEGSRHVHDPLSDQVVAKPFTRQARELRTFSIAVSTPEMEEPRRMIRCVDWTNQSRLFQKGDRVRLDGYFEVRSDVKDGQVKRVRQFLVQTAEIERAKPRQQAA